MIGLGPIKNCPKREVRKMESGGDFEVEKKVVQNIWKRRDSCERTDNKNRRRGPNK